MFINKFRALCTASFAIVMTSNAWSADLIDDAPIIPQPSDTVIDTSLWGGFYVGAYGGYSWFDADGATAGELSGNGERLGVYTGYNWDLDNSLVTGMEIFGGYSGADGSAAGVTVEQEWDVSLRARLGYAFERSILYSFAGLSATSVEAQAVTGTDTQTLGGYTLGLGWETHITDNITGRIEYGFSDYQSENFALGNPTANSIDFQDQSVNVGIGLKY